MKQYCIRVNQIIVDELAYGLKDSSVEKGDLFIIKSEKPLEIGQDVKKRVLIEHEGIFGCEVLTLKGTVLVSQ